MRKGDGVEVELAELAEGVSALTKVLFCFFLLVIIFKIFAILAVFIITLLMYNSHTIQSTHLKYIIPNSMTFSVFTELFSHYHGYFENVLIIAD